MLGNLKKLKVALLIAALPMVMALGGCESHSQIIISNDDTYTLKTDFSISKSLVKTPSCEAQIPGLEAYKNNPKLKIIDDSTKDTLKCHIEIKSQHISKAQKPFVTIKHYGGSYQVALSPIAELSYLDNVSTKLSLSIIFPGQILSVDSKSPYTIEGNSIEWHTAKILSQGFIVTGQDHTGISDSTRWLIFFLVIIGVGGLLIFLYRDHPTVASKLESGYQLLQSGKNRVLYATGVAFSYLDLVYLQQKRDRRKRKAQRKATSKTTRQSHILTKREDPWKSEPETIDDSSK